MTLFSIVSTSRCFIMTWFSLVSIGTQPVSCTAVELVWS